MLTLIFPGQGSQFPGMGKFLWDNFKMAKESFEEASEALSLDMKKLCFDSSEADLALTENTQPAILNVSIACFRVLKSQMNLQISALAGHSVGEYAALVAADSLPFSTALKAVRYRGQVMQSAVPVGVGGMAAVIGLENSIVDEICKWTLENVPLNVAPKILSAANYNCPGQVVISGSKACIDWLKENYNPPEDKTHFPKKLKMIPLNVSAPFHCAMMKPAENKMRQFLANAEFLDAKIPVSQNFTSRLTYKKEDLKENLIRQVSAPVLWTQSMLELKNQNLTQFIECGAGKILQGLLKKIDPSFQVWTTQDLNEIKDLEAKFGH